MNATCALFGHDWFWRFALRLRMCRRCLRLDVQPVPHDAPVGGDAPTSPQPVGIASLPVAAAAATAGATG
jgi:hypothetical protein